MMTKIKNEFLSYLYVSIPSWKWYEKYEVILYEIVCNGQ